MQFQPIFNILQSILYIVSRIIPLKTTFLIHCLVKENNTTNNFNDPVMLIEQNPNSLNKHFLG